MNGSSSFPEVNVSKEPRTVALGWLVLWVSLITVALLFAARIIHRDAPLVSMEFSGIVQMVRGDEMLVQGNFFVEGHPETLDPQNIVVVTVRVDDDTSIVKRLLYLPDPTTLGETDGWVVVDDLRSEEVLGFQEDIVEQTGITIYTDADMFGRKRFNAERLLYVETIPFGGRPQ